MQFNSDPNKQANEIIFSRGFVSNNLSHPLVKFNINNISRCPHQKHLRVVLDSNINFNTEFGQTFKNFNKIIGIIRLPSVNLPRNALLTIYKPFIEPHLDYGNILSDKTKE